jgi:hypothetical protein
MHVIWCFGTDLSEVSWWNFHHAGSHGFVLERKGYSIFIALSMPLVSHSFILFQSSTLAEHPSFMLFAEGKVHRVNYSAVILSM